MTTPSEEQLVFDWAEAGPHRFQRPETVMLDDETLRDGLQSPSVTDPPVETKIRILHLMDRLGIERRGFHQTRHTFAQMLLDAGKTMEEVCASMRHKHSGITASIYHKPKQVKNAGGEIRQFYRKAE